MKKRIYPTPIENVEMPESAEARTYSDAGEAVAALTALYERNTTFLRAAFETVSTLGAADRRYRAFYPEIRVSTSSFAQVDSRLAYGHMVTPGDYATTVTRPDLFSDYLEQQLRLILTNHGVPVTIGDSATPIPLHFAFAEGAHARPSTSA